MADAPNSEQIFISYSRQDGLEIAAALHQALSERGFSVWRDQSDLDPNKDFSFMIEKALKGASHVIVCLSPSIVEREDSFVRREILYAQAQKKVIIPLVLPSFPKDDIPVLIQHLTWIDFQDFNRGLDQLINRLEQPIGSFVPPPLPQDPFRKYISQVLEDAVDGLSTDIFQIFGMKSMQQPHLTDLPEAVRVNRVFRSMLYNREQREFDNFQQAFDHHKQRILLLGTLGSGKTITLAEFTLNKVYERLADMNAPLPICVCIRTWDGKISLLDWLADQTNLHPVQLKTEIEARRVVLILDGLDELASHAYDRDNHHPEPPDFRVDFMQALRLLGDVPVIVSCRVKDYDDIVAKGGKKIALDGAVVLKPLSELQIQAYLESQPALLQAAKTDQNLFKMLSTPLILRLFLSAYSQPNMRDKLTRLKNLSDSPGELRDEIVRTYVEQIYLYEENHSGKRLLFDLKTIYGVLGSAAAEELGKSTNNTLEIKESTLKQYLPDKTQIKVFTALMQNLRLLSPLSSGYYQFSHHLLRDYFALPYCLLNLRDANNEIKRRDASWALGWIRDVRGVDGLIDALNDYHFSVQIYASWALGQIADSRAIQPLRDLLLETTDQFIIASVCQAFTRLGKAALPVLTEATNAENLNTRAIAVRTLGEIGDPVGFNSIYSATNDVSAVVRNEASRALKKLKT